MRNEIVINAELGETRVALIENGEFAELHIERQRDKSVVGNVVKGRVSRVLPGMQAAFVDIGLEKAAFLYVGDYFESVLETGETEGEPGSGGRRRNGGRGRNGRSAPPRIDTVLQEGQEIIVQIAKEPIGSKGARITSSLSIPGRHLVLTPWSRRVGVSRRIGSDKERRRLREVVERLRPQNLGFIIRTAGDGVTEADLQADIRYLATVWAAIQQRHAEKSAPAVLYSEHDLPLRIVRDMAGHETKRIVADNREVFASIKSFVDRFVSDPKPEIDHYTADLPIFEHFDLESQIHANLERKVWLKSGGSLVIDKSEALTAIDVNTGRFVGKRDLEETVLKTNLEAVHEVVHQLRFRNLGGLIIIDLIDMESASNRDKVYRALGDALRADKARTNILKISELGLVEMTRKRTRENLVQTLCEPCSHCEGRGYVLSTESVGFRVLREIRKHLPSIRGRSVAVAVNPHVAEELLTRSKQALGELSEEIGRDIEIRSRPGIHQERFELTVLESGSPANLDLPWLRDRHPDAGGENKGRGGRRDGRRRGRAEPEVIEDESLVAVGEIEPALDEAIEEPSADHEEPSADHEEPSAELEKPVAEREEPSVEHEKPSEEKERRSAETVSAKEPSASQEPAPDEDRSAETDDRVFSSAPDEGAAQAQATVPSEAANASQADAPSVRRTTGGGRSPRRTPNEAAAGSPDGSAGLSAPAASHAETAGASATADSGETSQPVDSEAESRIIPRSE